MKHLKAQVSLNESSEEDLARVSAIGPENARRIVEYRTQHGPFDSLDDLRKVPGVSDALISTLREALSVEGRRMP